MYVEYVGSDFTFERFKEIRNLCWNEDYRFLTIYKTKTLKWRYRNNLKNQ
jgi:hypothetical protein